MSLPQREEAKALHKGITHLSKVNVMASRKSLEKVPLRDSLVCVCTRPAHSPRLLLNAFLCIFIQTPLVVVCPFHLSADIKRTVIPLQL